MLCELPPALARRYWRLEIGRWMRGLNLTSILHDDGHATAVCRRVGLSSEIELITRHSTPLLSLGGDGSRLPLLVELGYRSLPGTWSTLDVICRHYVPLLGADRAIDVPARIAAADKDTLLRQVAWRELHAVVEYLRVCCPGVPLRVLVAASNAAPAVGIHALDGPLPYPQHRVCAQISAAASKTLLRGLSTGLLMSGPGESSSAMVTIDEDGITIARP